MTFKIDDVADIGKVIGCLKLAVSGDFKISKEILKDVLDQIQSFATKNGVSIKIISPSDGRELVFTGSGIVLGSLVGLSIAGLPGAVGGAIVGGVLGYAAAHITITMSTLNDGNHVIFHTN